LIQTWRKSWRRGSDASDALNSLAGRRGRVRVCSAATGPGSASFFLPRVSVQWTSTGSGVVSHIAWFRHSCFHQVVPGKVRTLLPGLAGQKGSVQPSFPLLSGRMTFHFREPFDWPGSRWLFFFGWRGILSDTWDQAAACRLKPLQAAGHGGAGGCLATNQARRHQPHRKWEKRPLVMPSSSARRFSGQKPCRASLPGAGAE